jgi:hypothetical protein
MMALVLGTIAGCYSSHLPADEGRSDAAVDVPIAADVPIITPFDAGSRLDTGNVERMCDLSRIECDALPFCLGDDPANTLFCDDIRICLLSDPGDEMAAAIAEVSTRIVCSRADSCDFLCAVQDGGFDDEVRSELCEITRVAPAAQIQCSIYGP